MNILLLGATGLLGRNVLNLLLDEGHKVVVLIRNRHGIREITSDALTIVEGSLTDYPTLQKAATGCQAVINCAGTTDMSLLHYEDYLPINSDLCLLLTKLTETTDTKTIVHISTANTIGYGSPDNPADENEIMREPFASSFYARSKREGEKHLINTAQKNPDCHIIILNPGFMIGPWDAKPSSGRLLLAGYRKPLMVAPSGGKSFVAVNDVAAAALAALTHGRNGERYLITGVDLSLHDFYLLQAKICGYRQHVITIPRWLLSIAGSMGDMIRRLKISTQLSSNNIRQLTVMEYYSCQKAIDELGYKITSLEKAINEFFLWQSNNRRKNKN